MNYLKDKKFYLDTNILRDIVSNRNRESAVFFELAKALNLQCFTSTYALMELVDIKKDEIYFNDKVIGKGWDVGKFLKTRSHIQFMPHEIQLLEENLHQSLVTLLDGNMQFLNLSDDGWGLALGLSSKTCLASDDSLHFATLLSNQCNFLVTNDQEFIKEAKAIISETDQSNIQCLTSKESLKIIQGVIENQLATPIKELK
jgi:predicted nucleic acid-binding protein